MLLESNIKSSSIDSKKLDKIAIFGGSFEPLHTGHMNMAGIVLESFDIDKLIILPSFQNRLKDTHKISAKKRFEWVKDVFLDSKKILISDYEVLQNRAVASIESILYFKNLYKSKKIYFIIGEDNLYNLPKWKDFERLKNEVEFIVFKRKGYNEDSKYYDFCNKNNIKMQFIEFDNNISSSKIRQNIESFKEFIPEKIRESVILELKEHNE